MIKWVEETAVSSSSLSPLVPWWWGGGLVAASLEAGAVERSAGLGSEKLPKLGVRLLEGMSPRGFRPRMRLLEGMLPRGFRSGVRLLGVLRLLEGV